MISYCGIDCEKCVKFKGKFAQKAKEILKAIEISKLDEWKDEVLDGSFNYDDFKKGLIWFSKNMYCEGCKNGGGIKDCQIRKCVISKGLNSCLDCELRNNCKLYSEIS